MSRTIDEKIVEMRFDNKQFKDGASETMSMLDKLKQALNNSIGSQSFDGIDRAASKVNLSGIQNGVEALANRFSMLGIVAMRVIENITDGLMNKLNGAIHTVTDSIVSGGVKRAMNIENAHFQLQGLMDDEKEVQAIMGDAMDSVDGTAYAYDEAAKAASMFAATGLRSGEQMQLALKAIAGVAATTNSDYASLSQIFTTVSGQGKVMADQLNQLAVRGLNGAAALRDYFNKVTSGEAEATEETLAAIKKMTEGMEVNEADIRGFVKDGKISFDIFSEAMGRTFGDHAKKANETFNGALSNIKAALARVGANFISPLIGQKGPIVNLFNTIRIKINDLNKTLVPLNKWFEQTVLSNVVKLTRYIGKLDVARYTRVFNEETGKWEKQYTEAGQIVKNFYNILESGKNIFTGLVSVMKPVVEAFKEVFSLKPGSISQTIEAFKEFTSHLRLSDEASKALKNTCVLIFKTIQSIASAGISVFQKLFSSDGLHKFGSEVLLYFNGIVECITKFVDKVREASLISVIFDYLREKVHALGEVFSTFIDNMSFENVSNKIHNFSQNLTESINNILGKGTVLSKLFNKILEILGKIKNAAVQVITSIDPIKTFFSLLNGVLLTSIVSSIKKITQMTKQAVKAFNIKNIVVNIQALPRSIEAVFMSLRKSLDALSKDLNAKAVKEIATAMLLLSGALLIISTIDGEALGRSLAALTVGLVELTSVLYALVKFTENGTKTTFADSLQSFISAGKIAVLVGTLTTLSVALLILTAAVKNLSSLDWNELAKGLLGVTVLLGELVAVVFALQKTGVLKGVARLGIGLITIAIAVNILVSAVRNLGSLDFVSLIKGLGSVFAILFALNLFVNNTKTKKLTSVGLGLVLVAASIKILESAVRGFGQLQWEEIVKGLVSVGGLLLGLGAFTKIAGGAKRMITVGTGMVILAAGIRLLVDPLKEFAQFSWMDIIQSMTVFGVTLGEMVLAMKLMPKDTILKATGVVILAEAIKMLSEPLKEFASLSLEEMAKSLVVLGASLAELVVAINFIPASAIIKAAGLVALVEAIKMLVDPLTAFGAMDLGSAIQSIVMLGAALAELVLTLHFLPKPLEVIAKAAAMVILAESVKTIAEALVQLGGLGIEGAVGSIIALGGAMFIMVEALNFLSKLQITKIIPAVAALLAISLSLKMIAPAFVMLGNMDWGQIGRAAAAMALALGILIGAFAIAGAGASVVGTGALIIVGALVAFGAGLAAVVSIITSAILKISTAIDSIVTTFKTLMDVDAGKFNKSCGLIGNALTAIGRALKEFGITSPIGAMALRTVSEALSILSPALREFASVADNGKMDLSFVFMRLTDAFKYMAEGLKEFSVLDFIRAEALKDVAAGISILAPAMALIVQLDSTKFNAAMITIGNAFIKFGEAIDKTPFWGASMRAEGIKTLTEGIGLLATGLPPIMEMDSTLFNATLISIANGFVKFAEAIAKTPFWGAEMRAEGIKTLIDGINMLADNIPKFIESVDSDTFLPTMTMLGKGFSEFGKSLQSAPFWDSAGKGQGIATLVDSIGKLSRGVQTFNNIVNANLFESTMTMLGNGFTKLGQSLSAAPLFNAQDRGEGIAIVVDSIKNLAEGLKCISEVEGLNIEDTLDSLGTAIFNFGQAIGSTGGIFGIGVESKANAIAAVINTLSDLVPPIKELCQLEYQDVKNVLFSLGYSLKQYAGAVNGIDWFTAESNSEAIGVVIKSIGDLVPTLQALCKLDYATLKQVLFSLGYSLQQFASAVNGLSWSSEDKAKTMDQIIDSIAKFGKINFTSLNNVIASMDKFVNLIAKLNGIELKSKNEFIKDLGDVAELASKNFENKFRSAIPRVQNAASDMLKAMSDKFKSNESIFQSEGSTLSMKFLNGFQKNFDLAFKFGENLINKILSGIQSLDIKAEGEKISQSFLDGLNSKMSDFESAGKNAGDGFVSGISKKLSDANKAGKSIAEAAYSAAQKSLDSHSPSRKMAQLGSYAGEGFILGLRDWVKVALRAGEELGDEAITGIQNGIDLNTDLSPVITPVLDLDNLKDEANKIGGILDLSTPIALANSANISFSGGISKMFDDLEASIPENSNDDVVEAVNALNTNMMGVMRTLGQLQVVLDTGTMVGELVNPIDQALGFNSVLNKRGVR